MATIQQFDLKAYLKERAEEVDQALETYIPMEGDYLGNIGQSMRYCLFPGGKRFRPVICLAAAEALGKSRELAMPAACAFEMIHCFSLAHDDLPCMDDDDERRGKPTCHKVYVEAGALLAADGVSIWAFHVAARSEHAAVEIVKELAEASGHPGMVGGQVIDFQAQESNQVSAELLKRIHATKTGALIRGSVRCGALAAGADQDQLGRLSRYAERVGLVFQITDDILDAEEDHEAVSFPAVFGMEASRKMAAEATQQALEELSVFGAEAQPLRALATFLLERDH